MFILIAAVAFIGGVMVEKYLSDAFEFGVTETFVFYLRAATIELVLDVIVVVKARLK